MKRLLFVITLIIAGNSTFAHAEEPRGRLGDMASYSLNEEAVHALNQGEFEKAITLFKKALQKDSQNLTAAYNLAGVYLSQKQEQQAIKLLEEYARAGVKDAGIHRRLGDSYFSSQNLSKAKSSYQKALDLNRDHAETYLKIATVHALEGDSEAARKILSSCVDRFPQNHLALGNLASLELSAGNNQVAISAAKRAVQIKPEPELYLTMGIAYENQGDDQNALIAFKNARDTGANVPQLEERIAALEKKLAE